MNQPLPNVPTDLSQLLPGFADPARQSQQCFRRILDAIARPGRVQSLADAPEPPAGLHRATAAVALTLLDFETPLWLDPALRGDAAQTWLRFHCGCPLVDAPSDAAFAIVAHSAALPSLDRFNRGDDKYPDRSTSVIVQLDSLREGAPVAIRGPGIRDTETLHATPLPADFWAQWEDNGLDFQLGVDLMFCAGDELVGLPRTTQRADTAPRKPNQPEKL